MSTGPQLHLVPVRSRQAKDFVRTWHRHHPPPAGQIFAVGAADDTGILRAVAIVGRPVARHLDDGTTLEVTRTASDGTRNTNSLLYSASWRAAKALGYRRLITYTQQGGKRLVAARRWMAVDRQPTAPGWMAHPLPASGRTRQRPHCPIPLGSPCADNHRLIAPLPALKPQALPSATVLPPSRTRPVERNRIACIRRPARLGRAYRLGLERNASG
ncbi:XF1762 family protein [Streptomyces anulatus]|uniref:XF1762 family protein n=1 Tax=Streptomyces anulatus TaxID=1892 RepID=UPI0033C8D3AE